MDVGRRCVSSYIGYVFPGRGRCSLVFSVRMRKPWPSWYHTSPGQVRRIVFRGYTLHSIQQMEIDLTHTLHSLHQLILFRVCVNTVFYIIRNAMDDITLIMWCKTRNIPLLRTDAPFWIFISMYVLKPCINSFHVLFFRSVNVLCNFDLFS